MTMYGLMCGDTLIMGFDVYPYMLRQVVDQMNEDWHEPCLCENYGLYADHESAESGS